MNRAQRRLAARQGRLCEHGYAKKANDHGRPYCPHGCGFPHSQRPADSRSASVTTEELR